MCYWHEQTFGTTLLAGVILLIGTHSPPPSPKPQGIDREKTVQRCFHLTGAGGLPPSGALLDLSTDDRATMGSSC